MRRTTGGSGRAWTGRWTGTIRGPRWRWTMSETFDDIDRDAPAIPKFTCPAIDRVITCLEFARAAFKGSYPDTVEELTDLLDNIYSDLDPKGCESELEDLRADNEALRSSATFWRDKCQEVLD